MKKYSSYAIIAVVCLLVGRYVLQPKQKVETVEVIKYVEKKEESTNTRKETIKRERKDPDGGTTTEIIVIEDSSSSSSSGISSSKEVSKKIISGRGISFGVLAITNLETYRNKPNVGILLSVPVLGNLSFVTTADSTKRVGVGLSLEF
jgi:predicted phosphoribosyltransferase